jgi:hypothetical protein
MALAFPPIDVGGGGNFKVILLFGNQFMSVVRQKNKLAIFWI